MKYFGLLVYFISLSTMAVDITLTKARIQSSIDISLGDIAVIKADDPVLMKKLKTVQVSFDEQGWLTKANLRHQLESVFVGESFRLLGWSKVLQFHCASIDTEDLINQVKRYLVTETDKKFVRLDSVELVKESRLPCLATSGLKLSAMQQNLKHIFKKMRFSFIDEKQKLRTIDFIVNVRNKVWITNKSYNIASQFRVSELDSKWLLTKSIRLDSAIAFQENVKLVSLRALRIGEEVDARNVRYFGGVSKGQQIKVIVYKNGIKLEADAIALSSARAGQEVKVLVKKQIEPLLAKVHGEGIAYVAL